MMEVFVRWALFRDGDRRIVGVHSSYDKLMDDFLPKPVDGLLVLKDNPEAIATGAVLWKIDGKQIPFDDGE